MTQKITISRAIEQAIIAILIIGAIVHVFTPGNFMFIKKASYYTVHIMLAYLILGLIFLAIRQTRLMFVAFGCCAAIALFLKGTTFKEIKLPERTKEAIVKVAHFNISSGSDDYMQILNTIQRSKADVVSIQEITPDWDIILKDSLSKKYPYCCKSVDFSVYGLAIYSSIPFSMKDTFYCDDIPNLAVQLDITNKQSVTIISSYIAPPLYRAAYDDLKKQLDAISSYANKQTKAVITLGDYNMVPWSNEIQNFREKAFLLDSRRGFTPTFANGKLSIFDIPVDHVFYNDKLKCIDFETVSNASSKHLGIIGTYQFNNKIPDAEKTNQ